MRIPFRLTLLPLALTVGLGATAGAAEAADARHAAGPKTDAAALGHNAAARHASEKAFADLKAVAPQAEATWQPNAPGARLILDIDLMVAGATPDAKAHTFLQRFGAVLGAPGSEWRVMGRSHSAERDVIQFAQWHAVDGTLLAVLDRSTTLTFDASGRLLHVASDALPVARVSGRAAVTADAARRAAVLDLAGPRAPVNAPLASAGPASLALLLSPAGSQLVWAVEIGRGKLDRAAVYVDATSGQVVQRRALVRH